MHTDEYEISLSRELTVCKNTIQRIRKTLELLEQKHNTKTETVMEQLREGHRPVPEFKDDYDAWESSYASLKKWEELERQYQELYRALKI
jgi:hypothetical protein